jgi:hypothetical protein
MVIFREDDLESGLDAFLHTTTAPVLRIFHGNLTTGEEGAWGSRCDWDAIVVLKEVADAFHPEKEWRPPVLSFRWGRDALGNTLGDWKGCSDRDREQDWKGNKDWEALIDCTRESLLSVGVGGGSIGLVDRVRCDCFKDFKAIGFDTVDRSHRDKESIKWIMRIVYLAGNIAIDLVRQQANDFRIASHSLWRDDFGVGVEDSELVVCGDVEGGNEERNRSGEMMVAGFRPPLWRVFSWSCQCRRNWAAMRRRTVSHVVNEVQERCLENWNVRFLFAAEMAVDLPAES